MRLIEVIKWLKNAVKIVKIEINKRFIYLKKNSMCFSINKYNKKGKFKKKH